MSMLKILTVLTLILFPLGEILRIDLSNNITFKPADGLILITILLYIMLLVLRRIKFPKPLLSRPIIIFLFLALFSLLLNYLNLTNSQFITALLYWVRFVSYAGMYFVVFSLDKEFTKKIPLLLLIDGIVILLLGFLQYFLYPNLRNLYYLGWDEHNYRLFSSFLDPNFAGAFFVLYFLLILAWFYNNLKNKNTKLGVMFLVILFFTFIAIFLTYSRSAMLMFVAGTVSLLFLIERKNLVFAFFGVIAIFLILLSPTFNKENTNPFRITSSLARVDSYYKAIEIIRKSPIFGVGFNAYRYASKTNNSEKEQPLYENHADAGTDSSLLFATATTGIVGLFAYLYMWYTVFRKAFYLYYRDTNIFALTVICSGVGLLINSIFINSLFFPSFMLWMWILIALMEQEKSTLR